MKTKSMPKRLVSIVLSLAMVAMLLPATAFADEGDKGDSAAAKVTAPTVETTTEADKGEGAVPTKEEPAKEEPAKEEPTKEEPAEEEPAEDEPAEEEPAEEEPAKDVSLPMSDTPMLLSGPEDGGVVYDVMPLSDDPTPLDTPTNLHWDGKTAKWNAVPGAVQYLVTRYQDGVSFGVIPCPTNEYNFATSMASRGTGNYTFTVQATADYNDIDHTDSEVSASSPALAYTDPKLATPTGLTWDGTTAKWNAVPDADTYEVALYKRYGYNYAKKSTVIATTNSFDLASQMMIFGDGSYRFEVTAKPADATHTDSAVSGFSGTYNYTYTGSVTTLATPTGLTWDGTTAKWDAVTDAANYTINLYKDDVLVDTRYAYNTEIDLYEYMAQNGAGNYTFTATAKAGDSAHANSAESTKSGIYAYSPTILTTPTNLAWNGYIATWDIVPHAGRYYVELFKDGVKKTYENVTTNEFNFCALMPLYFYGNYTFKVTAYPADGGVAYGVSDKSAESGIFVYAENPRLDTPTNLHWDGKVAKWDAVPNADRYFLLLYQDGEFVNVVYVPATTTEHDFASDIEYFGSGSYTFTVGAAPAGTDTAHIFSYTSPQSPAYNTNGIYKLDTPTGLTWDGNKAKWNAVPGTKYYAIRVRDESSFFAVFFTTSTEYNLERLMMNHGEQDYNYTIYAIPATSDTTHLESATSALSPTISFKHTHTSIYNSIHHAAVAATCTAEGNTEYWECTYCGKYFTDAAGTIETTADAVKIAKLPHTPSAAWHSDNSSHWHVCSVCNAVVDKTAHTYGDWTVTKAATDSAEGIKERTCTACGITERATIPKTTPSGGGDGNNNNDNNDNNNSTNNTAVTKVVTTTAVAPQTSIPRTSDESNLALLALLMLASGAGLVGATGYARKKRKGE